MKIIHSITLLCNSINYKKIYSNINKFVLKAVKYNMIKRVLEEDLVYYSQNLGLYKILNYL
jgi:hypothetical protein